MIEAGLQQRLAADPTVAGLVSTRIYPVLWPDKPVFPLITYQRISTVTQSVLSGSLSMTTVRMQFDAWSNISYSDVKAIAAALNASLESFQGILPDGTAVDNIVLDSSTDYYDSPSLSYRVQSDYLVSFYR